MTITELNKGDTKMTLQHHICFFSRQSKKVIGGKTIEADLLVYGNYFHAKKSHDMAITFTVFGKKDKFIVGKIIKNFYPIQNIRLRKFLCEHWNYHPIRKAMVKTHESLVDMTHIDDSVEETFCSLDRLYES